MTQRKDKNKIEKVQKLLKQEKIQAATALCQELLKLRPHDSKLLVLLGIAALKQNDLSESESYFQRALSEKPNLSEAHFHLATLYLQQEKFDKAIEQYQKVSGLDPSHIQSEINLGLAFESNWRLREAQCIYQRVLQEEPQNVNALANLGRVLRKLGKLDESIDAFKKALEFEPKAIRLINNLGEVLCEKDAKQEAIPYFKKALALTPNNAVALHHLVLCRSYADNISKIEKIQELLNNKELSDSDAIHLHFALGKIYDDSDQYDKAFFQFTKANQLFAKAVPFDEDKFAHSITQLTQIFDAKLIQKKRIMPMQGWNPLFIVGMPNSGKSMVAKVLTQYSDVASCGQQRVLLDITKRFSRFAGKQLTYPEGIKELNNDVLQEMAYYYINELSKIAGKEAIWFCDIMPTNYLLLGLIAILFPAAKIVHCTRHPLDLCLMSYFEYCENDKDFAFPHDLEKIARYYQQYAKLMGYWRGIGIDNKIEVKYESFANSPKKTLSHLFEFLGVSFDHKSMQLPAFDMRSIGRWEKYQPFLQPAIDVLYPS